MRALSPFGPKAGRAGGDEHSTMADDEIAILDEPLPFVWPLAGPFGAIVLSAMAWLSI